MSSPAVKQLPGEMRVRVTSVTLVKPFNERARGRGVEKLDRRRTRVSGKYYRISVSRLAAPVRKAMAGDHLPEISKGVAIIGNL